MSGFVSGGLWGLVLGGVAVAGASLVGEQPARNDPPAEPQLVAPDVQGAAEASGAPDTELTVAEVVPSLEAPEPIEAPIGTAPEADVSEDIAPQAETASNTQPEAADIADAIAAPIEGQVDDVQVTSEEVVLPSLQSPAPQAPDDEARLVVNTDSGEPLPEQAPDITVDAPVAEAAPEETSISLDVAEVSDEAPAVQAPAAPAAPETSDTAEITGTDAPEVVATPVQVAAEEVDEEEAPAAPPTVVSIIDDDAAERSLGDTGVRVNRLTGGNSSVRVNRLTGDATAVEEDDVDAAPEEEFAEGTPAIIRYGADGANPEGRPEVSIVLVDDGTFSGAVAAVAGVSFPVTVMMNPSIPDATERMKAYRDAGIEVGIQATLPVDATASDIAVFFEAAFATLPETVAVLDTSTPGLQAGDDEITQAIAALSEDGRGLVTLSRGLNSGLRNAEEQGVPTGLIYRDLDENDQDARVIRRFMDQAAFRARQESGVILLGRIRGETISALIQWGAANRASQVAMVPVSKVLLDDE